MPPNVHHDFEEPRLDVQGFVVDYFGWRAEQERLDWYDRPELPYGVQPEHLAFRKVAAVFERKNQKKLSDLAEELIAEENQTFQRFCETIDEFGKVEFESPFGMSYARLIGVLAFGGVLITKMLQRGMNRFIYQMTLYTTRFVDSRIRLQWVLEKRSWKGFLTFANEMVNRDEKRQAIARRKNHLYLFGAAAVVAVGACLGVRYFYLRNH